MKKTKNIITILLCLCLTTACIFTVCADSKPIITVSSATAKPGEKVTIDLNISQNPGIMAMAFCVTYDNKVLNYEGHKNGYITTCTLKNHSDKGYVSFVNVENSDKAVDDKIISFTFTVKDDAAPGKYTISLANSDPKKHGNKLHNSFSNSNLDYIIPTVLTGSVTINETCENAGHKFSDWAIITPSNCTDTGIKKHSCLRCDFSEENTIPITHDFEESWTVDNPATPEEDGVMSRHCKKCDEVTDKITFSYEEIGDDDTSSDNSSETPSDIPSVDNSSSTDSSSSNVEIPSSDTSSDTISKPNIDNITGEKVPQQEAEKLENYQPPVKEEDVSNEDVYTENDSSQTPEVESKPTDSDAAKDDISDSNADSNTNKTFFATPMGIAVIIIGIVGLAIIALMIILIIRRKNK